MELTLERIETLERALELAPIVDRFAAETMEQYAATSIPEGVGRAFFERVFTEPETVVLIARRGSEPPAGVCISAPLVDPLLGTSTPIVALLHVDRDLRHRGLARQLIDELRAVLAQRGFDEVSARVAHNDDALISMGERWGFTRQWELMVRE